MGNLSAGGTGKSPMVAAIVRWLQRAGCSPCIAMRGYGAPPGQGHLSDEAMEYRELFPQVAIVAQPNRVDGLLTLFAQRARQRADEGDANATEELGTGRASDAASSEVLDPDVVVLDDGFQHRQIARQLDIVLVDRTRSPFDDALLPAGLLREPVSSLRRAHAIVITRATPDEPGTRELAAQLASVAPDAPVLCASHTWRGVRCVAGAGVKNTPRQQHPPTAMHDAARESNLASQPASSLRGKRLFAACAIGNPQAFLSQLASETGTTLPDEQTMVLADHDAFEPATIGTLLQRARETRAEAIVVTGKDWVKLRRVKPEAWPCEVFVPQLELCVHPPPRGGTSLEAIVLAVAKLRIE